jgi:hypothetical protein
MRLLQSNAAGTKKKLPLFPVDGGCGDLENKIDQIVIWRAKLSWEGANGVLRSVSDTAEGVGWHRLVQVARRCAFLVPGELER